jgi:hypothetical protein
VAADFAVSLPVAGWLTAKSAATSGRSPKMTNSPTPMLKAATASVQSARLGQSSGAAVTAPEGCPRLALWTLAVAAFSIGVGVDSTSRLDVSPGRSKETLLVDSPSQLDHPSPVFPLRLAL